MQGVSLVTGGGSGIGRTIAIALSKHRPVLILGRDEEALNETQELISSEGGECAQVEVDLNLPVISPLLRLTLADRKWFVESLVLNAAIWRHGPTVEFPAAYFNEMMRVNVSSNFELLQMFLPGMLAKNRGAVVFNCGIVGLHAFGQDAAYVASKHALLGLAKSVAQEHFLRDIRFASMCTGYIEGKRTDDALAEKAAKMKKNADEFRAIVASKLPAKRIISQQEFAAVITEICDLDTPARFKKGEVITFSE